MKNTEKTMDQIVALCKGRGFVYPGSEIYGGLANSWDYGPLGVELKNNVKRAWWKKFVQENPYNVGLDAAILMNPEVWVASGHVSTFNDPLIDCKACKMRHRADKLIEGWCAENGRDDVNVEAMTNEELVAFIRDNGVICPGCGKADFTDIRKFNLMFKTHQGVTEDSSTEVYLRPETAQGIFVNFPAIQRTTRKKLPFGVCQVGKSFRNEITPGNFIFRIREFEQMELEFFCQPGTDLEWFQYWREFCRKWLVDLGLKEENLRLRDPKSWPSTPRPPPTSSSCSPSAGASCGAWPTAPTTTSSSTRSTPARISPTSTRRRTSTISPMSSSPPWAPTA